MEIGTIERIVVVEPLEDPFTPAREAPEKAPAREVETESPELVPA